MEIFNSIFYMYSKMDRSSQTLLFLIILISLMLLSILVINAITKKKNEQYEKEFSHITRYSNVVKDETKPIKMKQEPKQEQNDKEVEVIEVINDDSSIEGISKLIENTLEQDPIDLTSFEEEQEKDAIISYDELVKRAGAKKIVYKKAETVSKVDDKNVNADIALEETKNKFKASQIVSPIYGVQKVKDDKDDLDVFIDLEDYTFDSTKKDEDDQMQKDMEFLGSLKKFRSELD